MIENTENELIETSHKKGLTLEKEFCEFLKSDLGWERTRIRSQMASKWNMRGTEVDVLGERLNEHGEHLKRTAKAYLYVCVFASLIGILITLIDVDFGGVVIVCGVFFLLLGLVFFEIAKNKAKEHVWVECKNLKGKATIKQLQIMIAERNAYNESENKEYKIIETHFVSANGFIDTALKYALDNDIKCFIRKENSFKEVTFWANN